MNRRRLALTGAAAATAAPALLLGGALRDRSAGPAQAASPATVAAIAQSLQADFSPGNTVAVVLDLQERLRANPQDGRSYALLGLAYQQRARETGDPIYYTKSEGALRRALALDRNDLLATLGLGSLALSRHRFADALALGRRAQRLAPASARSYGVIGDALVELGRYREAFRAYDHMATMRPDLAAYARVSHGRELLGRWRGAVEAMELAADAAGASPEPLAWTQVELGNIYRDQGREDEATRHYRAALRAFPGYHYALDALAQVEAVRSRYEQAIALERRAVDAVPLPQYVGFLADLYRASGQPQLAREQERLIGATDRLLTANGVKTDLEIALYDVDHGRRLEQALSRARRAHAARPSIEADDVLAWALARNGRCVEALRYSQRAFRLGTQDAVMFFHRGMIERCLGNEAGAKSWFRRALALNPHFSLLWAPTARRAVR